ncbi:hypothetical protein ASD16_00865 [Cellulomonas sp. Root485]|uniref:hypothetical protein n=1 Tax=Cellulomonas sp. Root485 TaxID=1736546 RepID=UPI0006FD86D7|nr:hypothetical protein [Cellulomonas sp. Root485]KQY24150.1 hypothetical protein ASD16_00865 [Cellulomonas sp. Root485]
MNHDLESALGELEDRAERSHRTGRAPLPVARIAARARARRRTRAALTIGGAAAAAVLVAGTAYGLLPDRSPAPPAISPSPSVTTQQPSPTPTPTVPAVLPAVLPTGDPARPYGTCGSLVDAPVTYPVDDRILARIAPDSASLPAGGHLVSGGEVERSTASETFVAFAVPVGGPRVAVVRDGVVVGTAGFYPATYDAMSSRSGNQGESTWYRGPLDLTVCDPGDDPAVTVGRPLPAGAYELRPWADVVTYGGADQAPAELAGGTLTFEQAAALDGAERATALGDPVSVTVTGEADEQLPLPGADAVLDRTTRAGRPACGAPAPATPVRTAMLDLQLTPAATTLPAGEALHATATVQYTGPGRLRAWGYYAVEYWIVRDGVVVGTTVQANDAFSVVDLGAGAPLLFTDEGRVLTSCVADSELPLTSGDPLPPGEYTVIPAWLLSGPTVWTPTETVLLQDPASGGYALTLGASFPVTLT